MKPKISMSVDAVYHEANGEQEAWDDVSGAKLDPKLVEIARGEEMEQFKNTRYTSRSLRMSAGKLPVRHPLVRDGLI